MAITLSYGYIKPEDGDTGVTFWDQLAADIQRLNDHTHNGTNSAILTAQSVEGVSDTISSASWSATSGGTYRQLVTTPPGITFDAYARNFVIANGSEIGHQIYPSVEKVTNTTYYVYTNDNTIDLTVLYLV